MYTNQNVIKCSSKKYGTIEYKPYTLFTEEKILFYTLDGTKLVYSSLDYSEPNEEKWDKNWKKINPENYIKYSNYMEDRYNLKCKLINLCCLIIELYVPGGDNIPGLTEYSLTLEVNNSTLQILVNDDLKTSLHNISSILPTKSYEVWSFANYIKGLYHNQLVLAVNNPAKDNYNKALEVLDI